MSCCIHKKAGFSLVEVALAILVISVGLVAVFGLFPSSIAAGRGGIDDTQAALFAEEVLNGVQAQAKLVPWSDVTNITLKAPAPDMWENSDSLMVSAKSGANKYQRAGTKIIDYTVRYILSFAPVYADDDVLGVRLQVWNGEYGDTNDFQVFYTEIYKTSL